MRADASRETQNAQALQAQNRQGTHRRANAKAPSLLAGLVFDARGEPMVAVHATKSSRRYRYYVSKSLHVDQKPQTDGAFRVSAQQLEGVVAERVIRVLHNDKEVLDATGMRGSTVKQLFPNIDHWEGTRVSPGAQIWC